MKDWNARLQVGLARIDRLSRRDRALLLMLAVGLLILAWDALAWTPLHQQGTALQTQRAQLAAGKDQARRQVEEFTALLAQDPDAPLRQQRDELLAERKRLEEELDRAVAGVVNPQEMPGLLARLLKDRKGLRLVRLENLPPGPLLDLPGVGQEEVNLYRHPLQIELEGAYLEALAYLQAVETAAPGLSWHSFELRVTGYPLTRIRVVVHTLSSRKEWIGV